MTYKNIATCSSTIRLRPPLVAYRLPPNPNQADPLALQPSARHCSVSPLATGPLRTGRCSNPPRPPLPPPPPHEVWVPPLRPLCQWIALARHAAGPRANWARGLAIPRLGGSGPASRLLEARKGVRPRGLCDADCLGFAQH
jgi:hypothetical protein